MKTETCLALLTNDAYFDKMIYTLSGILSYGYTGDICIVIGNDLLHSNKLLYPILQNNQITIKHFNDINFTSAFIEKFNSLNRDSLWKAKIFQYHKFYMFDIFFKQWKYVLYIDSGINVYGSIQPIIDAKRENKFLAHSDAYPEYKWTLATQFVNDDPNFEIIKRQYNLNIDYPQTTIMYYDTNIIENDTFNNLLKLAEECRISKTNDQGIIALYFASIKQLWEQIQLGDDRLWYYDYMLRPEKRNKPSLLLKIPV